MIATCDKTIVLFESDGVGMQVSPDEYEYIGFCSSEWDMSMFEDFHGSVTLSNDGGKRSE